MNYKKLFSVVFVVLIFVFLLSRILSQWNEIAEQITRINPFDVILAILLAMPVYILNTLTWHFITKSLQLNLKYRINLRIWLISNTARYLPGGFWQYPSRIYLLNEQKVPKAKAAAALLLEGLFNLIVGSMVVLTVLLLLPDLIKIDYLIWSLLLVILVPLLGYFFKEKIEQKVKILKSLHISGGLLFLIFMTILFQYFFAGFALFMLFVSILPTSILMLPILVGIFTASWLLGYLTIFAPSGLGVQEASVATLLSFYTPFAIAGLVAIMLRIVLILAEVLCLAFVFLVLDKRLDLKK